MFSVNFGANRFDRIRETLKYALGTAAVFGLIWTAICVFVPNLFTYVFMQPTEEILAIAPSIIRRYGMSFLLLPLNIFSTYYFQALLQPRTSFIVSVGRGAVVSGVLICLRELADKADCVIVGRCADWMLRAYQPFRIFVYADMEHRMLRCRKKGAEHEAMSDKELRQHIQAVDRHRASYYSYCTDQKWATRPITICASTRAWNPSRRSHTMWRSI